MEFNATAGSIRISFTKSYLDSLSVGAHAVKIYLKGGVYDGMDTSTTLTVLTRASQGVSNSDASNGRTNPNTGLADNLAVCAGFAVLSFAVALGLGAILIKNRITIK